jgi:hypothetical protein
MRKARYLIAALACLALAACGSTSTSTPSKDYNPSVSLGTWVQFDTDAGSLLGLNSASPAGQAVLNAIGQEMCYDIQSGDTPDQLVTDVESTLTRGGDVGVSDSGTSAAIADAILDICPELQSKFNQEQGTS